jgi:transposase
MAHKVLELSAEDILALKRIVERGSDWRARSRAQTLLHCSEGLSTQEIVVLQGLNQDTVNDRRKHWIDRGFESLTDKARSGAPPKINAEQQEYLAELVRTQAVSSRELVSQLEAKFGVLFKQATVVKTVKRLGFVWKRTRHSLKKNAMN